MNTKDAISTLRELGLRVPLEDVIQAVRWLRNDGSLYKLYTGENRIVSKVTARKIKGLLEKGKLEFLSEVHTDLEAIRRAQHVVRFAEHAVAHAGHVVDKEREPEALLEAQEADKNFEGQMKEIMEDLPHVEWDIEHLESLDIPTSEALSLLVEHSVLVERIPEWTRAELLKYVEIHYIAYFTQLQASKNHRAPQMFIEHAASAVAKGVVEYWSPYLFVIGHDILSYQVWRGPQFLDAFRKAHVGTYDAARNLKRRYFNVLSEMLNSSESSEVTDD